MACRSIDKANEAKSQVEAQKTPNNTLQVMQLDLASFESVRGFVRDFEALQLPLHVLVLNAGITGGIFELLEHPHHTRCRLLLLMIRSQQLISSHRSYYRTQRQGEGSHWRWKRAHLSGRFLYPLLSYLSTLSLSLLAVDIRHHHRPIIYLCAITFHIYIHIQTNQLGHFLLTTLLLDKLKESSPSSSTHFFIVRFVQLVMSCLPFTWLGVVVVASMLHKASGGMGEPPTFAQILDPPPYDGMHYYKISKLANVRTKSLFILSP